MAKRTMSGSEMLAHSRNRHEQKSLKERLDELSHSKFLVRDTSRVETHRWRQFLRENHRSTGWSPMSMKPDILSDDDGAGVDGNEQSGSTLRRRYDLQAIKKYQRPWACTLRTGDSYNKVYRELAEAGESSQKALYTPRQATLAVMGVASFARGRTFSKHPRLAQTVPAVVGIERAKSVWLPGAKGHLLQANRNGKLLNSRLALKSASSSQDHSQSETITELDPRVRAKLESQNISLKVLKKAKSVWLGNDKGRRDNVSDASSTSYGNSSSSKVKFQHLSKMGQSVMDLNRLRKSVYSWKCCMCGGDKVTVSNIVDDKEKGEEICKSSFYDASVAMRGLQRAKTVLDGLLYKDDLKCDNLETNTILTEHENKGQIHCSCKHSITGKAVITANSEKPNSDHSDKKRQTQITRKPLKKKQQASVNTKKIKNAIPTQENDRANIKTGTNRRRQGVGGRPQGLFENCDNSNGNGSIEPEKSSPSQNGVGSSYQKKISAEKEYTTTAPSSTKEHEIRRKDPNCAPLQRSGSITKDSEEDFQSKSRYDMPKELDNYTNSESFQQRDTLHTPKESLSGEDVGELSPLSPNDDVFLTSQQNNDATSASANPLSEDDNLLIKPNTAASLRGTRTEINNARQDEKLELRDRFDAYAVGKSRTRHLSTVKRRKFSFVSTAVSAFVKNPSSDDLQKNTRQSRVRSYSVTSQASIESAATSVDGSDSQRGRKTSKWQLENIICASSLAHYAGRATRNEKGEISYTRPWRQKKKKVAKLEVNVFYAIARFMLQKQKDFRKEKEARKSTLNKKADGVEISEGSIEGKNNAKYLESINSNPVDNTQVENLKKDKNIVISRSRHLSPANDSAPVASKKDSQSKRTGNSFPLQAGKKAEDRGSFSSSSSASNKRGSFNKDKTKTRGRTGSAMASSLDPHDIPNLASIIDPSKTPINLTNGVLEYDDDLTTVTSGLMIPGRKQVRYKGILLRNYVSPQDRYKIEPRMRFKKATSIRWHAKEGAVVTAHSSAADESASRTMNVVFPKQARQRALAKMVEDNHSQPADNSARQANAELRAKIDQFLLSVEPFCLSKQRTVLF